jgi:hypothetical protein
MDDAGRPGLTGARCQALQGCEWIASAKIRSGVSAGSFLRASNPVPESADPREQIATGCDAQLEGRRRRIPRGAETTTPMGSTPPAPQRDHETVTPTESLAVSLRPPLAHATGRLRGRRLRARSGRTASAHAGSRGLSLRPSDAEAGTSQSGPRSSSLAGLRRRDSPTLAWRRERRSEPRVREMMVAVPECIDGGVTVGLPPFPRE